MQNPDSENLNENKSMEDESQLIGKRRVHSPGEKFHSKRSNNPVPSGRSLSKNNPNVNKPHVF